MKNVTAIFDIGKTNKKLLLFDENYKVVYEYSEQLPETTDEDGFPCEDISLLQKWIKEKWVEVSGIKDFNITGLNFTSYGASLVHLDKDNNPVTPLNSYLKPYPSGLAEKLYEQYDGKWNFSVATCSPPLGMLNAGLQLYWLKNQKPELFNKIIVSLHLPQYLSFLFSNKKLSEFTSIGCHTALWNFSRKAYHQWVLDEGMDKLLAPLNTDAIASIINIGGHEIKVGSGLHDSSAALIPYLQKFKQPFLLVSTGTWCITLNPFTTAPFNWQPQGLPLLTNEELAQDCLCFLTPDNDPVKASRIFLGKEYEYQTARLMGYYGKTKDYFLALRFDSGTAKALLQNNNHKRKLIPACLEGTGQFPEKPEREWNLEQFKSCEDAYVQLLLDLTCMLKNSIELVDTGNTETIFVEGGFGSNEIFMNLLANHFPGKQVKASHLQQATALGAALYLCKDAKYSAPTNNSGELNWSFQHYKPSGISSILENYYKQLIEDLLPEKVSYSI